MHQGRFAYLIQGKCGSRGGTAKPDDEKFRLVVLRLHGQSSQEQKKTQR